MDRPARTYIYRVSIGKYTIRKNGFVPRNSSATVAEAMISLAVFAGLAVYAALLAWLIARLILHREARPGAPGAPRGMSVIIPSK